MKSNEFFIKKTLFGVVLFLFFAVVGFAGGPVGEIISFAGPTAPDNFLICDGSAVSRTEYAALFKVIGTMYGAGDGSTTFNLPDYRGMFLRGVDLNAGKDPDAGSRGNRGDGTSGDNVGTSQGDNIKAHKHYVWYYHDSRSGGNGWRPTGHWDGQGDLPTSDYGGSETRPANISVLYCIRYNDGSGALGKVYDSGWFKVSSGELYPLSHNLGTQKLLVSLYFATDTSGSNMERVDATIEVGRGSGDGGMIHSITPTQLVVQPSNSSIVVANNWIGRTNRFSGYYRVIALALESPPSIRIISPNGDELWTVDSLHTITWSSTGSVGSVDIQYSIDNGSTWSTVVSGTANTGSFDWTVPGPVSTGCLVKITAAGNSSVTDTSNSTFTIANPAPPPEISLNRTSFYFGADTAGVATGNQTVLIENSGSQTLAWNAAPNATWIKASPASGTGSGILSISVDTTGLAAGVYTGKVSVSGPGASNSPQSIAVTLKIYDTGTTSKPFGEFSTPKGGSTVRSSVPITGWVVDDIEVKSVKIFNGSSYVGDAVFVEGARPDVEQTFPGYPKNYQAGWGYMMLTNFLPGQGNGVYTIHAIAADAEGNLVTLGSRTITADNANAVKPFGAIDTPVQGGIASGSSYINWGWVLTPQPNFIPSDGSTINVWVDGVDRGHPKYNEYRADIATLFPGYANSNNAVGYAYLDTTAYKNGVHTIQWTARDSAGNFDGIGSRYFTILNIGSTKTDRPVARSSVTGALKTAVSKTRRVRGKTKPVRIRKGYDRDSKLQKIFPDKQGKVSINIKELERLEIHFFPGSKALKGRTLEAVNPLPIGSSMDSKRGIFSWCPGAGFYGNYSFVFIYKGKKGKWNKTKIAVKISSRF